MTNPSPPEQSKAKKSKISLARQASLKALNQVFSGQSLSAVQAHTIDKLDDARDRGLANEIVNGVLRWRWQLEFFISRLVKKPLKKKDIDVQLVLLMAIYELKECRTPDYAVINESVELVRKSGKKWAAGLVNAVLRGFTREKEKLIASINEDQVEYSHPDWILKKIKNDWPENQTYGWRQILDANNQRPAFWLRVNQRQFDAAQYQQLLNDNGIESEKSALTGHALKLSQGIDVRSLPGFADGAISVQDVGAQLAAELLDASESKNVLDLCAAPGGKTCHILERNNIDRLIAVEFDGQRMLRVSENLQRLRLLDEVASDSGVELVVADAREYKKWWDGKLFDRILIDAPCSASGVIRRHPDIKSLRRESDIKQLVEMQADILLSAWEMLAPGGQLLYVTCSIFKDENQNQIDAFFAHNSGASNDAVEIKINANWGVPCDYGRQLFPGEQDADGFYFCKLKKLLHEK